MSVVAVIQARMGSSRLPGKVLKDISGKPMLWHVVNRLRYSKLINKIVVATSVNKKDDVIEKFCKENNIDFYRGSEKDVLDRYYQTAILYKADYVVRITADCPLIDPQVVDKVISGYLRNVNTFDGANNTIDRTYPRGLDVEIVSFSALEKCWKSANKDYQREHVMVYIYECEKIFKLHSVKNSRDLSHFRWTVDEEADLRFVREVYNRLYQEERVFFMEDVLKVLGEDPYLRKINKDIRQKHIIK